MMRFVFAESTQADAQGPPTYTVTQHEDGTRRMWSWAKVLCGFTTGADCAWTVRIQLSAVGEERSGPLYVHEAESVP